MKELISKDQIADPGKAGSPDILKVNPMICYSGARNTGRRGEGWEGIQHWEKTKK